MERQQEEGLGREGRLRHLACLGRAGAFSLGLVVGFLVLGYVALRALELAPKERAVPEDDAVPGARVAEPVAWSGVVTLGEARVVAQLFPLHDEPVLESFRANALRARYQLGPGEPWRLYLSLEAASPAPPLVRSARVLGQQDAALVPFAELARPTAPGDPVHALLAALPAALATEHARPLVLWGNAPPGVLRLELEADGACGAGELTFAPDLSAPRWYAGLALEPETTLSLEQEVARLQRELERERARRIEREQAIQEFTRLLAESVAKTAPVEEGVEVARPLTSEEQERLAAAEAVRARASEIGRALSVLMRLEGLHGLDLLECGSLLPGEPPAMGPVVFRCLDERGLLTGSVNAERLRLEASAAAHTLTLVLEQGFESHGGARVPFLNGVRRITLSDVDPERWLEDCPELFAPADLARGDDDGRWNLGAVRRELNRLLALDTSTGWFRLHSLGGVRGKELRDVQLEELEPSGRVRRRLFADRMQLGIEDGRLELVLLDGAAVRGEEKQPFRDGRHRIVLAGIVESAWKNALLPGFSDPRVGQEPTETPESSGTTAAPAGPGG